MTKTDNLMSAKPLLCRLGFHKWRSRDIGVEFFGNRYYENVCRRCHACLITDEVPLGTADTQTGDV